MELLLHLVNALLGLAAGGAVAAGAFAFLLVIGILPRWLGYFQLEQHTEEAENAVVLGIVYGTLYSVMPMEQFAVRMDLWHVLLGVAGIGFGIFVGCVAAALSEILHTFPVLFRRLRIKEGLPWVIACMAFGKLFGSMFYFLQGYGG